MVKKQLTILVNGKSHIVEIEDTTSYPFEIYVDGKKMSPNHTKLFGNEFVSKKMRELTGASRDIRGRGTFTMIDKTL